MSEILATGPIHLNIFTTNRCNMSCFYCNRHIQNDAPGIINKYKDSSEFKFNDLKFLLNKYPSIRNISYIGIGEPLLCRDLIPMAEYSKQMGKSNALVTNGLLLHQFQGKIAPNFDFISISLHGLNPKEFEEIARIDEKYFSQLQENIKWLIQEESQLNPQMTIRASVVFIKEKFERIERAAIFCEENQIPVLDIQNYIPNSLQDVENCLFDDDHFHITALEQLKSLLINKVTLNMPVPIKRDPLKISWQCPLFFNTLRVDGNGSVSGCTMAMVPKPENGNFREEKDVWNNAFFKDMRQRFKKKKDIPDCCRYCKNAQ